MMRPSMAADYDFVVQLHHSVVRDVQVRTINASLLSNLAVTSLTLEGNVFADCQPEVATTKDRQPGATSMAPSMLKLLRLGRVRHIRGRVAGTRRQRPP